MKFLQTILSLIGRIFISVIFIVSAINKILQWQDMERGLISLFCDWHSFLVNFDRMQGLFSSLLQWVPVILVCAIVIELIGGCLIFFGWKVRIGSFLLLLFFIPTTFLFHHFWFLEGYRREMQIALFLKNMAIIGGLFYVLAYGGAKSTKKEEDNISVSPVEDIPELEEGLS